MEDKNLVHWIKGKCIGLTGGIATGKSTVAGILRAEGFKVFDADLIAREIVSPGMPAYHEIVHKFGQEILSSDLSIDRSKLGSLVWNDPAQRAALEAITHPRIRDLFLQRVNVERSEIGTSLFFYEAALLFEAGRDKEFFKTMATYCSKDEQLRRLMSRNQIDRNRANQIIQSQMAAAEKKQRADLVVDTECSLEELTLRIHTCLAPYTSS